jgi:putative ABC transport system permease protein
MTWYRVVVERLRSLFRKDRRDADMEEEIRFHIDMETEKHVRRGLPPAEARRRALVAFGGVDRFAEQTRDERGTRPVEDFFQDLRFALRQVRRNPGFSLVTALTVGLGVGATVLGFVIADTVIFRPLPYPDADRLVRIQETNPQGAPYSLSAPNYLDAAASTRGLADMAALSMRSMVLLGDGEPVQVQGMLVTPGYFELLGVPPEVGRAFAASDAPGAAEGSVVVLGRGIWERLFASDPGVLGRSIDIDGVPRTVVGVAPAYLRPFFGEELWVPFGPDPAFPRGDHRLEAVGRLAPGGTVADLRASLGRVADALGRTFPDSNDGWGFRVRTFPSWLVPGQAQRAVGVLAGAGILLLLLSCASVSTLLLSRVSARQREVALRSALGARTQRIVRQLLVESLVLSTGGAVVGIFLVVLLVPVLRSVGPAALPRLDQVAIHGTALAFALLTTLGASVLFGLVPAVHAARGGFARALQESGRVASSGGGRMRAVLVAGQMALAVVLLVGAGLLASTFVRLGRVDPGFDPDGVMAVRITPRSDRYPAGQRPVGLFYRDVLEHIRAIPGVRAAGAYNVFPFGGWRPANRVAARGRAATLEDFVEIQWRAATPGFFETMGIPLVRGRYLQEADDSWDAFVAAAKEGEQPPLPVVITANLADRLWAGGEAVGNHLVWNQPQGADMMVVGVVEPIRDMDLASEAPPMLFLPGGLAAMTEMTVLVKTDAGTGVAAALRRAVWAVDADTPVPEVAPLERALDGQRATPRLNVQMVGTVALIALLLATLSLYGVVSFATTQRTREIGIRIALGASGTAVVGPVVAQALRLALAGAAVGVAGALALSRLLRGVLFGVGPTDPVTYVAVVAALGLAASLAAYLPARRAAGVEPREALVTE